MTLKVEIELHDSVIGSLSIDGSDLKLSLSPAYVHQSLGTPGIDSGDGLVQDAIITIRDGFIEGEAPELPTEILDGECVIGSQTYNNSIPLPLNQDGAVRLVLNVAPDYREIMLSGTHISVRLMGDPKWIEKFEPA